MDNNPMYPYNEPMIPECELAHAYVPYQVMGMVYEPNEALKRGTLFPELYMPYRVKEDEKHC